MSHGARYETDRAKKEGYKTPEPLKEDWGGLGEEFQKNPAKGLKALLLETPVGPFALPTPATQRPCFDGGRRCASDTVLTAIDKNSVMHSEEHSHCLTLFLRQNTVWGTFGPRL